MPATTSFPLRDVVDVAVRDRVFIAIAGAFAVVVVPYRSCARERATTRPPGVRVGMSDVAVTIAHQSMQRRLRARVKTRRKRVRTNDERRTTRRCGVDDHARIGRSKKHSIELARLRSGIASRRVARG